MSNQSNEELLERASEAIELAARYIENEFTHTTPAKVLDELVAQVIKHIDDNNLDDLFMASLPALERFLDECSNALADQAREAFVNYDLIGDGDTY